MSILLNTQKIIKDWTDYNKHMNVAYYVLIFDLYGAETLMTKFKMGENSAKTTKKSTMVVENKIKKKKKKKKNNKVNINLINLNNKKKKIKKK